MHGPGVMPETSINGASIVDVAPTLMAALGASIPESYTGRVLTEVFEPDLAPLREKFKPGGSTPDQISRHHEPAQDQDSVIERLQQLGYLD